MLMDGEKLGKPSQHRVKHAWISIPGLFSGINPLSAEGCSSWGSAWRSNESWLMNSEGLWHMLHAGYAPRKRDDPGHPSWHSAWCGDGYKRLQLFKATKITALIKYYTEQEENSVGGARKGLIQETALKRTLHRTQAGEIELLFGELGEHCWCTFSSQQTKTTTSHITQGTVIL